MTRWQNRKTGNFYALLAHGTDTTNARAGREVIVYSPENNPHAIYVRETEEFFEKFTHAGPVLPGSEPQDRG